MSVYFLDESQQVALTVRKTPEDKDKHVLYLTHNKR